MSLMEAFLDGATGTGLFRKLSWPGAPTELIDSSPVANLQTAGAVNQSERAAVQELLFRGGFVSFTYTRSPLGLVWLTAKALAHWKRYSQMSQAGFEAKRFPQQLEALLKVAKSS